MVADTSYYDLLEISVEATDVEIKRAYKKKAMQHHPDKNPDDPDAHETFQRIGKAYETLSDPNERASYDAHGPNGPSRGGRGGPGYSEDGMDDLFEAMFGGAGFGFGGGASFSFDTGPGTSRRKPSKGRDTNVPYNISLEESYKGKRVVMMLERDRLCGACKGSGGRHGAKPVECSKCAGKGEVLEDRHIGPGLIGRAKVICRECDGKGEKLRERERCKKCKGTKVVKEKKRVEFQIEPGTEDGERIALRGEGDEAPDIPPGDVIFDIHLKPHSTFHPHPTNASDLTVTTILRLSEALLGFSRTLFIHLDGRGIRIECKRGERIIKHGEELVIKGEGMPIRGRRGQKGDLWVRFEVEMPNESWAARLQGDGTTVQLPPPLPDLTPLPEVVDVCYLSRPPR